MPKTQLAPKMLHVFYELVPEQICFADERFVAQQCTPDPRPTASLLTFPLLPSCSSSLYSCSISCSVQHHTVMLMTCPVLMVLKGAVSSGKTRGLERG